MRRLVFSLLLVAGCASEYPPPFEPFDPGRPLRRDVPLAGVSGVSSEAALEIDLPSALALAGARSVEVRLAQARTDEVRQGIYAAWESLVPAVGPGIVLRAHRGMVQRATGQFVDEVTKQSEFGGGGATVQWQPGSVIFKALAASRRTDAAEAATDTARAESALAVAEAYYELVRARALVKIADQALEAARELAHDEEAKERRGAGLKADVLRAQADVAQEELARTRAGTEVAVDSARLAALLQLEPGVELVPVEDAPLPIVLVSSEIPLGQLLERALVARPELRESGARIEAARRDREGVTWGPLVPEADGGVSAGMFGPTFGSSQDSTDLGISVGWRIGPGGLLDLPAINAAAARVRQERIREEGLRAEIARQVVDARARALAAEKEVASARNGVAAAAEAFRLSKERFEKGAGIELEVLDARRALTAARTAEVQALVDLNRAQYRLLRAIGEPPR